MTRSKLVLTTSVHDLIPAWVAGVDWITCSAKLPSTMAALLRLGKALVDEEEGCGGVRKPWYFQGYAGYSAGQVSAGFKGSGVCVRASGAAAREHAAELIECADNVSRLDLQLTVRSDACGADFASSLYRSLLSAPRARGRPVERTLITSTYSGDTLYMGRRVSDQYGRIYNKSAEEKVNEDPLRWRFEVEYKRAYAKAAAAAYSASDRSIEWSTGRVVRWFADRGIRPPVSTLAGDSIRGAPRGTAEEAARLEWLKRSVRPAVRALAEKYGWPDMLALLGVPMAVTDRYVNESCTTWEDI